MAKENAFIKINYFSYLIKNSCHFSDYFCYRSDGDFDDEFAVRYWVLCDEMGKIWRIVIRKNITLVA